MKYTILLEKQAEGGYTVQCLEVPGAISQGETRAEALENILETIWLLEIDIRERFFPGEYVNISKSDYLGRKKKGYM